MDRTDYPTTPERGHEPEPHRDPLSGTPGAHPLGVAGGALGAGMAGAAIGGAIGGPVGSLAGAVVGAVAGGVAGSAVAERLHPTVEREYWREHFVDRPYVEKGSPFEDYEEAYEFGWESWALHAPEGLTFETAEPQLQREWEQFGAAKLPWSRARYAARDAWLRLEHRRTPPA
ncbi:MAG TPA: hypothetical protein VGM03_23710 [Phycisphaerae bacterium]|jgi:hypothetical protein